MTHETTTKYEVGQRVYWKNYKGTEFYAQVRAKHPHSDCSDCYALDAVFADNCADMPDNWANARDMRPAPQSFCSCGHASHSAYRCGGADSDGVPCDCEGQ